MSKKKDAAVEKLTIKPPSIQTASFTLVGTAPYVQLRFGAKAKASIRETQAAGPVVKKGKKREPKDFDALYEDALHRTSEGKFGIPAPAFRVAAVDACRIAGFKMTLGKMSLFVEADGFDVDDQTPLIFFTKGKPTKCEHMVRIQKTVDLRVRAMWEPGWEAAIRVSFDSDQFTTEDVANLLMRVGKQVGVGEGRPFSKTSCGMGWGTFKLKDR